MADFEYIGAPKKIREPHKDAPPPKPGMARVQANAHYGPYMAGDRFTVSLDEARIEEARIVSEQRFKVISRGGAVAESVTEPKGLRFDTKPKPGKAPKVKEEIKAEAKK